MNPTGQSSDSTENACNAASADRAAAFEELALEALREAGLRLTSPRIQVIRVLGESNRPLSANEIHQRIVQSGGRVDSVSVYRILAALQSIGAVHHIGVVDAYYACGLEADSVHDTQHFVCEKCGCVKEVDLPAGAMGAVSDAAAGIGFQASEIRLEVLGLCSHCQN